MRNKIEVGYLQIKSGFLVELREETRKCFIEIVESRSIEVLLEVIQRKIQPGSTICSDMWRGYRNPFDFFPKKILKSTESKSYKFFIDPTDKEAHTQKIESF